MTRYRIRLDREACEGIFACLVRDDRFVEADDGVATVAGGETVEGTVTLGCDDDHLDDAEGAAAACPVDAITVEER